MEQKDTSERPPDSDFQQQNLKAWQPLLTPRWVIGTFFLIAVVFVPIGIAILAESESVVTVEKQYQNELTNFDISLTIPKDMKAPVYFYYKLENFYQNHRRYVKSRSDPQLRGEVPSSLSACEPLLENDGKALYPCGLIAGSYFNDEYKNPTILDKDGLNPTPLSWTDKGIAWTSDTEVKFKFGPENFDNETMTRLTPMGTTLPETPTEDFIVWMRTAGLPTFKKLRYKINTDLLAGTTLNISIGNFFNVTSFKGTKAVFLSTTSALGGKNNFLGLMYIIVGSLCLLLAIVFLIKDCVSPRQVGDMAYFNWSGPPRASS